MSAIPVPRGFEDEGDYLVYLATEGLLTPETFARVWELQDEGWVYPRVNRWNTRSYVHHPYVDRWTARPRADEPPPVPCYAPDLPLPLPEPLPSSATAPRPEPS